MKIVGYKEYTIEVAKHFPDVDQKAIDTVVRHGLGMITFFQKADHDIYLNHNLDDYYFYIGEVITNERKRVEHSRKRIRYKLRLMFNLRKEQHDGYYYFSLNDEQYEAFKRGESLPMTYLYKLEEESNLYKIATHRFKVKRENDGRWYLPIDEYETKDAQYV